jgi:hypothetical protein
MNSAYSESLQHSFTVSTLWRIKIQLPDDQLRYIAHMLRICAQMQDAHGKKEGEEAVEQGIQAGGFQAYYRDYYNWLADQCDAAASSGSALTVDLDGKKTITSSLIGFLTDPELASREVDNPFLMDGKPITISKEHIVTEFEFLAGQWDGRRIERSATRWVRWGIIALAIVGWAIALKV